MRGSRTRAKSVITCAILIVIMRWLTRSILPLLLILAVAATYWPNSGAYRIWEHLVAMLLGVIFCLYSALVIWHVIRSEYRISGHCRCGYDLRGNESGRCPECGCDTSIDQSRKKKNKRAGEQSGNKNRVGTKDDRHL